MNTTARHTISDTIFHLVKDNEEEYRAVMSELSSLVPYEGTDIGKGHSCSLTPTDVNM